MYSNSQDVGLKNAFRARNKQRIICENKLRLWKYSFLFLNCVLLLLSAALVFMATMVRNNWSVYDPILRVYTQIPYMSLVAILAFVCVCTLIGYLAAFKNYYVATVAFGITLFLVLLLQAVIMGVVLGTGVDASDVVRSTFIDGMEGSVAEVDSAWYGVNYLQRNLQCCGADYFEDWFDTAHELLPPSCCSLRPPSDNLFCSMADMFYLQMDPCLPMLQEKIDSSLLIMHIGIGVIMLVEIVTLAVTWRFAKFLSIFTQRKVIPPVSRSPVYKYNPQMYI